MEREYKFNLKAIMMDKNCANYCTTKEAFGLDFLSSKVVSYQRYYKNYTNKNSFRLWVSFRDVSKKSATKCVPLQV